MRASRWSACSLLAVSVAILGAVAGVAGWYWFYEDGALAHGFVGTIGLLALVGGLWVRWRIGPEAPEGFRASGVPAEHARSGLSLTGRVAVEMLALLPSRFHDTDYRDRTQRLRPALLAVAVLVCLGVPLLIVAFSSRLTIDLWPELAGGFALVLLAIYIALLALFVPTPMLERDAGLRRLLGDVGINSILALRLAGVLMALALAAVVVAFWPS